MFRRGRRLEPGDSQTAPPVLSPAEGQADEPAKDVLGDPSGPDRSGTDSVEGLRAKLAEAESRAASAEGELEQLRARVAELQAGGQYQTPAMASSEARGSDAAGGSGGHAVAGDAMLSALANSLNQAKEESIRLLAAATKEAEDLLGAVVVTFERDSALIRAAREQAERDAEKATALRAEAERDAEMALSARREAESAAEEARAEAQRITEEARAEAGQLVEQGRQEAARLVEQATEEATQTVGQARSELEVVRRRFADQVTELRRAMDVANVTLDRFISAGPLSGQEPPAPESSSSSSSAGSPSPGPAGGGANGTPNGVPNGTGHQSAPGPAPPSEAGLGTF